MLFALVGVLVVTRSSSELNEACSKLMDTNMQLMASLKVTETLETKDAVSMSSTATTPCTDSARPLSGEHSARPLPGEHSARPLSGEQQPVEQHQPRQEKTSQLQQVDEEQAQPGVQTQPQPETLKQQQEEHQQQQPQQPQEQVSHQRKQPSDTKPSSDSLADESSLDNDGTDVDSGGTKVESDASLQTVLETVDVVDVLSTSVEEEQGEQIQDAGSPEQAVVASPSALSKDGYSPDEGYGPDIDTTMSGETGDDEPPSGGHQSMDTKTNEETVSQDDVDQAKMKTSESGIEIPAIEVSPTDEEPKKPFTPGHSRTQSEVDATTAIAVLEQAVQQAYESMTKQGDESNEPLDDDEHEEGASGGDDVKTDEDPSVMMQQQEEPSSSPTPQEQVPTSDEKVQNTTDETVQQADEEKTENVEEKKIDEDGGEKVLDSSGGTVDDDIVDGDDGDLDEADQIGNSKNSSRKASNESLSTDL